MELNRLEIKYITKKLAVPVNTVAKLTEEERDADLVLSEVSVRGIKKEDCFKISPLTYIKLVVYRYSYDTGFDINEKKYIAQTVYLHYLPIKNCFDYNIIAKSQGDERSRHFLIVASFFDDKIPIKIIYPNYKKEIKDGFSKIESLPNLSKNSQDWEDILKEINRKNWLTTLEKV